MKLTAKNTWIGIPMLVIGLILWLTNSALLFTVQQAKWIEMAKVGNYPSLVSGFIKALVVGGVCGYLVAFGFAISAMHKNMNKGEEVEWNWQKAFSNITNIFVAGAFALATFLIFVWWRSEL